MPHVTNRRDQLHLLSHADRAAARGLVRGDAGPFPLLVEGPAPLRRCEESTAAFCGAAQPLGPKLRVLLFQLPPSFKKDLAVLDDFLAVLPPAVRDAFEFRHASWHDAAVFERLRARGLALSVADSERLTTPVEITADYAYFQLRDEGYQPAGIIRWAETIAASMAACREVFVYFKHEDQGKGPELARRLIEALQASAGS